MALTGAQVTAYARKNTTGAAMIFGAALRGRKHKIGDDVVETVLKKLLDGGKPQSKVETLLASWLEEGV